MVVVIQLFVLFGILDCALYCSGIAVYLVTNVWVVFWAFRCVFSFDGS